MLSVLPSAFVLGLAALAALFLWLRLRKATRPRDLATEMSGPP